MSRAVPTDVRISRPAAPCPCPRRPLHSTAPSRARRRASHARTSRAAWMCRRPGEEPHDRRRRFQSSRRREPRRRRQADARESGDSTRRVSSGGPLIIATHAAAAGTGVGAESSSIRLTIITSAAAAASIPVQTATRRRREAAPNVRLPVRVHAAPDARPSSKVGWHGGRTREVQESHASSPRRSARRHRPASARCRSRFLSRASATLAARPAARKPREAVAKRRACPRQQRLGRLVSDARAARQSDRPEALRDTST